MKAYIVFASILLIVALVGFTSTLHEQRSLDSFVEPVEDEISNFDEYDQTTRRLQHRPYYSWYEKDELLETQNGELPELSCRLGTYRDYGNRYLKRPGGLRMEGCIDCPKGRYGSSTDLKNSLCTAACPRGTYRDRTGGRSVKDCRKCPEGTFGEETGLTTSSCSGFCTDLNNSKKKYYSDVTGLTTRAGCKECPQGYNGWQCRSYFRRFGESTHHYEDPVEHKRRWGV